jgi:hypothetical protein
LVILQRLQSNLEFDLTVPTSMFLSSFFHHPLEFIAPSLNLSKRHLQGPDLLLGVRQVVIEFLLTIADICKTDTQY